MGDEQAKPLYDVDAIQERVRQKLCQQQRDGQKELYRHWHAGKGKYPGGPVMMTARQILRQWFREPLEVVDISREVVTRITQLAEEVFWIFRHRKPHFKPSGAGGWEPVYSTEDATIVLMVAHTIFSKEYLRTREMHWGILAEGVSWAAPGCRCNLCAKDGALPPGLDVQAQRQPTTATAARPRVVLAVPLDDLVIGDQIKVRTAGHLVTGMLEDVTPAGRGRGLWLHVWSDDGRRYRVRSTAIRALQRV